MRIIALFVITFMMVVNFASADETISTDVAERARNATVLVANQMGDNDGGFGSGVVITPSGLVLTNYHVIHRADTLRVFFYDPKDNNYYPAEVIGIDPVADLALLKLKVDEKMLPLEFLLIETEDWTVAEPVMAIGHPMGIQWTVSMGHIASTIRTGKISPYVSTLQHSAEIHQGNSGGPLINADGEVVGINTYLMMPEKAWSGIAYAIRGDIVKYSVDQMLYNEGPVKYPAFRLQLRGLTEFGVKWIKENHPDQVVPENIYGMIVLDIEEGGWAYQQGMEAFDVVVAIDGEPINNMLDVRNAVMGTGLRPGDTVDLLIIRDRHFRKIPYEITWIDFTNYLDFYDSSMDEKEMPRVPEPDKPEEPVEDEPPQVYDNKDQ